jgi:Type IV secretion-system coupling protein DNA-binding domain
VYRALTLGAPVAAFVAILILFVLAPAIGWDGQKSFRADIFWFLQSAVRYGHLGPLHVTTDAILDGIGSAYEDMTVRASNSGWRILTLCGAAISGALTVGIMAYGQTRYVDTRVHYAGLQLFRAPGGTFGANKFLRPEIKKYGAGMLLAPGLRLSLMRELRNILLIATPNSGKTRIILFLVEQILGKMKVSNGTTHLLLHDTTGELRRGIPLSDDAFAALYPHRAGGWAWALGRDIRGPLDALAFSSRLIGPATGGENRMFDSGAAIGFTGCILLTMENQPENWGVSELRDTVLDDPLEWRERLLAVYRPAASLIVIDPETGGLNRTTASFVLSFRATSSDFSNLSPTFGATRRKSGGFGSSTGCTERMKTNLRLSSWCARPATPS